MMTLEQINGYLAKRIGVYYFPEVESKDSDFKIGQTIYYGNKYKNGDFYLTSTKIVSICKSKAGLILKTDSDFNFTTTYHTVTSTKKVDDRHLALYDIRKGEKIILKELEEAENRRLNANYQRLKTLIHDLKPTEDCETIDRLIEMLTD